MCKLSSGTHTPFPTNHTSAERHSISEEKKPLHGDLTEQENDEESKLTAVIIFDTDTNLSTLTGLAKM